MSAQTAPLRASAVSRQLADAGHQRAPWAENDHQDWTPGYRAEQLGADVVVYCEGLSSQNSPDAETSRLAEYALALTNLGYRVETVGREETGGDAGRHKLIVSRARREAAAP